MSFITAAIFFWVLIGHASIWVTWVNRLHGRMIPKWLIRLHDLLWIGFVVGLPLLVMTLAIRRFPEGPWDATLFGAWALPAQGYAWFCSAALLICIAGRLARHNERTSSNRRKERLIHIVDFSREGNITQLATPATKLIARIPGNQILQLAVQEKQLRLPRLAPALEGLSVAHLTDFHLTGQLGRDFYQGVVDQTNELQADLIAITGDLIDKMSQLDLLCELLAELKASHGVYFVLGNHDQRTRQVALIRRRLTEQGLTDLGGRWVEHEVNHHPILLAGNELPWLPPAAEMESYQPTGGESPLRILLSHSPDQIDWARQHEFDLMLAGHCHGGQVRLPLLGPLLTPSRYGTRFASGTFELPPTVLHVSRGIAGTRPIRIRCMPEITRLVLQRQE